MVDFLKRNLKFIIPIILIIIIACVIISFNINKSDELDVYKNIEYRYFTMYSTEGLAGVINRNGDIIIEPAYEDIYIPNPEEDVFFCFTSYSDYIILNEEGEEIFTNYEEVTFLQTSELNTDFEKYVFKYKKDGKYGLINFDGDVVLSADYDSIESLNYKPGELLIEKNEKYGVATSNGDIKIKVDYDYIVGDEFYTENDGYRRTGYIIGNKTDSGMLYGFLDNNAKLVLDVEYESLSRVLKEDDQDYYLIIMNNGKKGVYKNNKELIDQKYQSILYAENSDVFVVRRNDKFGIFNSSGKVILEVKYSEYSLVGNYISVQNSDGDTELYDVNGNKISNLNYTNIQSAGDQKSYIVVDEDGYYSIIGDGDTISGNYIYISYAYDNYFIFENEDELYGLLNFYSGVVIEPEYIFMLVVDGKNAIEAVTDDNVVDIYSKDINKTVSLKDAVIESIDENYTKVYSDTDIKYIDANGNVVDNTKIYGNNSIYAFKENNKWGFKNSSGEIVIEALYDFVTELNEYGFAGIYSDGKWGIVDSNGSMISDCIYEIETYYMPSFVGKYELNFMDTFYCIELE